MFWKTCLILLWSYLSYHLLVRPAFLDYSSYGMLATILFVLALWLALRPDERKKWAILLAAFFLLERGLAALGYLPGWERYPLYLISIFGILVIARLYGKVNRRALLAVALIALVTLSLPNRNELNVYNHFSKLGATRPLYQGETDFFPFAVDDFNRDGKDEILTVGNTLELEAAWEDQQQALKEGRVPVLEPLSPTLQPQALYPYLLEWKNGQFERIPATPEQAELAMETLPLDYIRFPYYYLNANLELVPAMQPVPWTESIMQVGHAPFMTMAANLQHIAQLENLPHGSLSRQTVASLGDFKEVRIQSRQVSGMYRGQPFQFQSDATQILGNIRINEHQEGLLLLGESVELWQIQANGDAAMTHLLTREMVAGLAAAEILIHDITRDGSDELLISLPYAKVLTPLENGQWKLLWSAEDESFRFEDVGAFAEGQPEQVIALDKSYVRDHPLRYMAGFLHQPDGLERQWKIFLPLMNLRLADLDGDGNQELLGLWYGKHQIYAFSPHSIPVIPILLGSNLLLLVFLWWRKSRQGKHSLPKTAGVLLLCASLPVGLGACAYPGATESGKLLQSPLPDYQQAEAEDTEDAEDTEAEDDKITAAQQLLSSLSTMEQGGAESFWYDGYVANNIQKRRTTTMYKGAFQLPHGYTVEGRWAGVPYSYYRWGDARYFSMNQQWMPVEEPPAAAVDPFGGLETWSAFFAGAEALPGEKVLGISTIPYQVRMNAQEWVQTIPSPYREQIQQLAQASPLVQQSLQGGEIKATVWIGEQDNHLYQIQMWIKLPLPDAGMMDQEIFFRFYKFNDPGISFKTPEQMASFAESAEKLWQNRLEDLQQQAEKASRQR